MLASDSNDDMLADIASDELASDCTLSAEDNVAEIVCDIWDDEAGVKLVMDARSVENALDEAWIEETLNSEDRLTAIDWDTLENDEMAERLEVMASATLEEEAPLNCAETLDEIAMDA